MTHLLMLLLLLGHVPPVDPLRCYSCNETNSLIDCLTESEDCTKTKGCWTYTIKYKQKSGTMTIYEESCTGIRVNFKDETIDSVILTSCSTDLRDYVISVTHAPFSYLPRRVVTLVPYNMGCSMIVLCHKGRVATLLHSLLLPALAPMLLG